MSLIKTNTRSANTLIGTNKDSRFDTIIAATGGTITTDGDFKVHTFTSTGNFVVSSVLGVGEVQILVVSAGGGGGFQFGGGGGAGGMLEGTHILSTGTFYANIGGGGSARTAANQTASGGVGGQSYVNPTGSATIDGASMAINTYGGGCSGPGGSGGYQTHYWNNHDGGSGAGSPGVHSSGQTVNPIYSPGSGAAAQGSGGGTGVAYGTSGTFTGGGGGGGAGKVGGSAPQGGGPIGAGGIGGTGRRSGITGTSTFYAGGGGGGYGSWDTNNAVSGGGGGGGNGRKPGAAGSAGTANTGGGGGGGAGATNTAGLNGGSGVIIFRYRFQ